MGLLAVYSLCPRCIINIEQVADKSDNIDSRAGVGAGSSVCLFGLFGSCRSEHNKIYFIIDLNANKQALGKHDKRTKCVSIHKASAGGGQPAEG